MARNGATIDDLMQDSLIGAMMRADRVEPQALRALLAEAATGLARRADSGRRATAAKPPEARRPPQRAAHASRPRPALPEPRACCG